MRCFRWRENGRSETYSGTVLFKHEEMLRHKTMGCERHVCYWSTCKVVKKNVSKEIKRLLRNSPSLSLLINGSETRV